MLRWLSCKQFNGEHGCNWCKHPGVCVMKGSGPPTCYYPFCGDPVLRIAREQGQYANSSQWNWRSCHGCQRNFRHWRIPNIWYCPMFYSRIHAFSLPMGNMLADKFVVGLKKSWQWFICRSANSTAQCQVDILISTIWDIKGSTFIAKAEIMESIYVLLILRGILSDTYLRHFFLFVHGIFCLLGDRITSSMVELAKASMNKFVVEMEGLYGLSACKFNVHHLTHLADGVRYCSPLWATSAFMFEANNCMLLKIFMVLSMLTHWLF